MKILRQVRQGLRVSLSRTPHCKQTQHKKIAIFDIDGTIFRSSLLIEFTDALIQEGAFSSQAGKVYVKTYKKWLDRKGTYEEYIGAVVSAFEKNIKGISHSTFLKIAKKVVAFHKNRVYRYSRDLVKDLKKKNYYLLAISNSPREIVEEFCRKLGFDKVYGRIYEINKQGKFTGATLYAEVIADKAAVLKRAIEKEQLALAGSLGVGDTESDIPFLEMVEKPICFNPNMRLYQHAKRFGWKIIVERKDVVYHL